MMGASDKSDRVLSPTATEPVVSAHSGNAPLRGPCAKQTTTATIVTLSGERFVGENDCLNPQTICPRAGMPTGVGYHLCVEICQQTGHAEVNACRAAGKKAHGGTLYLEGHYYACEPCKQTCAEHCVQKIVFGPPPAIATEAFGQDAKRLDAKHEGAGRNGIAKL